MRALDAIEPLLKAALQYASEGYSVFPLKPGTKEPGTDHGHLDASADPEKVREWWSCIPNANIGLPMQANGLVAVDPDTYKPGCGWQGFIAGKNIPTTWHQNTARGGEHFIFSAPSGASFPKLLTKHVEIISDGYIVAAPSVFEGEYYRRNGTGPPAPAPEWLLNAVAHPASGSTLEWETDPDTGRVIDGREAYLAHLVYVAYAEMPNATANEIAETAWHRFFNGTDLSRPSKRATWEEAQRKARHILRRQPEVEKPRSRLVEGVEPDPAPDELPPAEATARLNDVLTDFFAEMGWTTTPEEALSFDLSNLRPQEDAAPPRLHIAGAAGLGKSRATLAHIRARNATLREQEGEDFQPEPVWYVVRTIALAEELAAAYGEDAAVIRGRVHGYRDKGRKTLCERPDDVLAVTGAGVQNVARTLCFSWDESGKVRKPVSCPLRSTCGYYRQFEKHRNAEVYFVANEFLFQPISDELIPRPKLLVIDESPLPSLVPSRPGFDVNALAGDELGDLILSELRAGRDPRAAAIAAGWTKKSIRAHATALEGEPPFVRPDMTFKQIKRALKGWKPSILPKLLRKFSDELHLEREGIRCLTYSDGVPVTAEDGSKSKAERIWLDYRRHIILLRKNLPVLVLDATGDPELLEAALPGLTGVTIPAWRNAEVYQTFGFTASMNKMNGDEQRHRDEISGLLERWSKFTGLVVTYKAAKDRIALPAGWAVEHFGNLRGIDKHKDCDAIVVVGRLQVEARQVERMARGLFYDSEMPLTLTGAYEKRPVGFNMRNGELLGVRADRHACPIVERLRWQFTEAEITQAVDRLRLVHRADKATVILVNEVPTIPVDHLGSYRALVERMRERGGGGGPGVRLRAAYERLGGVLPLRADWLAKRFPDLWPSANAVTMELRDLSKRSGSDLSKVLGRGARHFEFRVKGQRGRASEVWAGDWATAMVFVDKTFPGSRGPIPPGYGGV